MNARELHLDDFIIVHDDREDIKVKVVATNGENLAVDDGNGPFRVPANIVKPIPLTEEVLNKNFPEYEEGYEIGWWSEEDGEGFYIEFEDSKYVFNLHNIKYVHQVQQIMRLCEFHREFEL